MTTRHAGLPEPTHPVPAGAAESNPIAGRIDPGLVHEGTPPGLAATPDIGALLRCLRRRWMTAFSVGVLLAGTAAATAYSVLSPSYTSFAQIRVLPFQPVISEGK